MTFQSSVLVVDDSSVMRTLIGRGLTGAGVPIGSVRFAVNGRLALEQIRAEPPGLLVTDVQMPEMSGTELMQALADEGRLANMPVVVVTSISNTRDLLTLVRLGAAAVIRKPIDMQSLSNELAPFVAGLSAPTPFTRAADSDACPEAADFVDLDHLLERRLVALLERFGLNPSRVSNERLDQTRLFYAAALPVASPFAGELRVWAHHEAANRIAAAAFDSAPGRSDIARLDALAELLNIVAREFLLEITSALGDSMNESTFGLPATFVVGPRVTLPMTAHVIDLGDGELLAVQVALLSVLP